LSLIIGKGTTVLKLRVPLWLKTFLIIQWDVSIAELINVVF